jgi:HAD superfamily hydrolase (TIGR01509 family)
MGIVAAPLSVGIASPRAVLWDLDGTLIDSAGYHWLAWRDTLAAEGRSVRPGDFANTFGKRNDELLRELFGPAVPVPWIERLSDAKEERFRSHVRERGLMALPGAMEWLKRLRESGWKQALASSAPPLNIEVALEVLGLRAFLDAVVGAEEVGRGKPDPAIFLEAARRLGVPPQRCIVVEDAPAGLEGARRAGMRSIGVLSAHHTELQADVVVASLDLLSPTAFEDLLAPP